MYTLDSGIEFIEYILDDEELMDNFKGTKEDLKHVIEVLELLKEFDSLSNINGSETYKAFMEFNHALVEEGKYEDFKKMLALKAMDYTMHEKVAGKGCFFKDGRSGMIVSPTGWNYFFKHYLDRFI